MKTDYATQAAVLAEKIKFLDELIMPIIEKKNKLQRELSECHSREFIAENQITIDDVETVEGPGKPWFGEFKEFGKWILENSARQWCEFNGLIYTREEAIKGDFKPGRPKAYFQNIPATIEPQTTNQKKTSRKQGYEQRRKII